MSVIRLQVYGQDNHPYLTYGGITFTPDPNFTKDTPSHKLIRDDQRRMASQWGIMPVETCPNIEIGDMVVCDRVPTGMMVRHRNSDGSFQLVNWSNSDLPDAK